MNLSSVMTFMQENLSFIFDKSHLDHLARDSGFIQRRTTKVQAADLVQLMTIEMLTEPDISLDGLCEMLSKHNPIAHISPQALGQRINTPGAAGLLEAVFRECLAQAVAPIFDWTPPHLLRPFGRILLQDSTTIRLNEKLAKPFRGLGGSGAKAALKLHAVYDYQKHQFTDLSLTDGTTSDTAMGKALIGEIAPGDLLLRDLGYFSIDQFQQIDQKGAFFLSRLQKSTGIYFSPAPDADAMDVVRYLDEHFPDSLMIELAVYLAKQRFPVRLVAYRSPQAVVNARMRKAKNAARKKSRQPTKAHLSWLRFSFYITNVPKSLWATDVIGTLYRLRWQIELIFKRWKSILQIDCLKGRSPYRIECLVYGRLCVVCLCAMLYQTVSWYAWQAISREVSGDKLLKWLRRNKGLTRLIRETDLFDLLGELIAQLPSRLLKQKRRRQTTHQRIGAKEPFHKAFSLDNQPMRQEAA